MSHPRRAPYASAPPALRAAIALDVGRYLYDSGAVPLGATHQHVARLIAEGRPLPPLTVVLAIIEGWL
jgi:hypothetical protein